MKLGRITSQIVGQAIIKTESTLQSSEELGTTQFTLS